MHADYRFDRLRKLPQFFHHETCRMAGWAFCVAVCLSPADAQELLARFDGLPVDSPRFGFGDWGEGVAISGDTVLVGSLSKDIYGVTYVFDRDFGGPDAWGNAATLKAFGGSAGDLFGWSVAMSGDTAFVTEHRSSGGASMYFFDRNQGGPNVWGGVARVSPTPANGSAVDIHGDLAIAGSGYANQLGAAYIFERGHGGANQWGQVTELTASDAVPGDPDGFGSHVAIFGDTVIVGAADQDSVGGEGSGSVYIFQQDHGGPRNWGEVKKLKASDPEPGDFFGRDVALFGDTAIVGAWAKSDAGPYSGAAYIFERNAGGPNNWGQVAKLTASDAVADDVFGISVSISRNLAVVAAANDGDSDPSDPNQSDGYGSVYVFGRNAGGPNQWGELYRFTDADGGPSEFFGLTMEMDGNLVVVGAPGKGVAGSVFVFRIPEPPTLVLALSVLGALVGVGSRSGRLGGQVCDE